MKKSILFVEDNPILLQMYEMMLDGEHDRWQVSTAVDARNALELMERAPFDIVISDMRMAGMSGIEFLGEVRQRHPRSSRIILSGSGDQEEVARSLASTHQFLAKPFDVKALKATLSRVCGLDSYLNDERLQSLVGRLGSVPSFPSLYVEIMKELNSEEPSVQNIAEIISKDPGMTAKILQIVNSAAMGLADTVVNPFDAVQYLGMGTVRSLVLSAHIFSCFEGTNLKGFSITELWNHGMKTGAIARAIMEAEGAEPTDAEDAYIAGMLHDTGKLMLADSLPEEFQRALALAEERQIPFEHAELEIYHATHAGAAAYLLGLWGLPAPIVEAVAFHHLPMRSQTHTLGPLAAVHVADVLHHELAPGTMARFASKMDLDYLAAIGIQDRLKNWRYEAEKLIGTGI